MEHVNTPTAIIIAMAAFLAMNGESEAKTDTKLYSQTIHQICDALLRYSGGKFLEATKDGDIITANILAGPMTDTEIKINTKANHFTLSRQFNPQVEVQLQQDHPPVYYGGAGRVSLANIAEVSVGVQIGNTSRKEKMGFMRIEYENDNFALQSNYLRYDNDKNSLSYSFAGASLLVIGTEDNLGMTGYSSTSIFNCKDEVGFGTPNQN